MNKIFNKDLTTKDALNNIGVLAVATLALLVCTYIVFFAYAQYVDASIPFRVISIGIPGTYVLILIWVQFVFTSRFFEKTKNFNWPFPPDNPASIDYSSKERKSPV